MEMIKLDPFTVIGKEWMLINSDDGKEFNSILATFELPTDNLWSVTST